MRIVTVFAVFVIIPHFVLYAQNDTYSLSTAFQAGVLYGQAEEIVYSAPNEFSNRTTDDKLSQLLWDMKPVFYYGITLDYAPVDPFANWSFFANLSLKTAIPELKSGVMEDRDWMSQQDKSLQTHFSHHDNITNEFFDITVKTGSSFPFHKNWLVAAYAAIAYSRFSFSGMDGYGKYEDYDGKPASVPYRTFSGTVISYTQEWLTIFPGILVKGRFFSVLSAEAFFQISPLIFCAGLDMHTYLYLDNSVHSRTQFMDDMNGGFGMEGGLSLSWAIRPWLSLSLEAAYRHISGTRGNSYNRSVGVELFDQEGEGGAGLSLFDSGVVVKIRF